MNIDNIRSNKPLYTLPRWNNKYGKRNKLYYLPDIFNKLPSNMLKIEKRKELKKKLKDVLLKNIQIDKLIDGLWVILNI